ncbi:MAG: HAMP domain-containing sensor histidine kinase [Pseudonocardia sediminis]
MRSRIVGLALTAVAFAVALFGIPLAIGLAHLAVTEEQASMQRLAGFTARSVQDDMSHDRTPSALPDGPDDTDIAVYDGDNDLVLGDGPRRGDASVEYILSDRSTSRPDDGDLTVTTPVRDGEDIIGAVRVSTPTSAVYGGLLPVWLGMAALAGIVLVAAWLLARRLALRLSGPLERIAADADRLGDGDFGIRPRPAGIVEMDRASDALGRTARRLDDLLARERAFSAEASHQLRTPLAGLRLRLESVVDHPERLTRETVEDGLASIDRLERTIDELLVLARERQVRSAPADLAALLAEAGHEWRDRLAHEGRSITTTRPPDLPDPDASAAAVRQILGVLLDNACLHGAGTVSISAREAGESAIAVDVADDGPGIPASALQGENGSQGMGLPLARRLAEAEGGRLTARQSPSVVTLLLPLGTQDAPDTQAARDVVASPELDRTR